MHNGDLAGDYIKRARIRLEVLELLLLRESYADVVREAQEAVELALKALLRKVGISPPRIHDVSAVLLAERARMPAELAPKLAELARISKNLRRDRELAFYGSEDLTPSDFYTKDDAEVALRDARTVIEAVVPHIYTGRE